MEVGSSRGAISGRVADHTGAPLAEVTVSLTPLDHQSPTASTLTSSSGEYKFEGVSSGPYRVVFTHLGFAEHSRPRVDVSAGAGLRIDVTLQVALTTEVTVSGRGTFRNLAELEDPATNLVGLASSASEGAVTARQLERRPIQRAGEIVESVPGMGVTQHSGEGKANQYYLRGFNLDHGTDFSTMVAGVPLNLPTHAHGHGYTDANFLIPELVTGVQYFKGPYAADAGDFASAGGVHINYATLLDRPMTRVSIGGHGWSRVFAAASPRALGGHLLAAAETARNDGPWDRPDEYRRVNSVLRYSRGDSRNNLAITALTYTASWNATDQIPRRAIETRLLPRFGTIDDTGGGRTARYTLAAERQWSTASTRTRVSAFAVRYSLDLYSNFTYFLDDPVNGDQLHQVDRRFVTGARVAHDRIAMWKGRPVETRLGLQIRRDDIGRVGLYRTRARLLLSTVREDSVGLPSGGVWTDVNVRWTSWLRSVAGIRVDGSRYNVEADRAVNSGRDAAAIVSPKASLVFGPWRGTELYANGGFGFHSNDARGATIAVDPADGSPAERVTPLARTRGTEIGLRTVALRGVQSTVALWRLALDSELVFAGDAGTTAASRPSRRQGIEWSNFAQLRRWLTLDADLAWSQARFTDGRPEGAHVPGSVERVASLGMSVDRGERMFGSLRWRHFGSRPLIEDNSVRSHATSLLSAQAGHRLSKRLSLIVDVFNLLDARHSDVDYFYTSRLPGEPAGGVDDVHSHPVTPRTARVTLAVTF